MAYPLPVTVQVAVTTERFALLVSDRRLTSAAVAMGTDQTKSILVNVSGHGRILVGYSGLARVGSAIVSRELQTLIGDIWHGGPITQLDTQIAARLDELFNNPPFSLAKAADRRFSVIMTGLWATQTGPRFFSSLITNFEDLGRGSSSIARPSFDVDTVWVSAPNSSLVRLSGDLSRIDPAQPELWRTMAAAGLPPTYVRDKLVAAIPGIAATTSTISDDVHSLILKLDGSVQGEYHVNREMDAWHDVDQLTLEPDGNYLAVADLTVVQGDSLDKPQGPAARPRQSKKSRCWCGSGKRYAACHGRKPKLRK